MDLFEDYIYSKREHEEAVLLKKFFADMCDVMMKLSKGIQEIEERSEEDDKY